MDNPKQSFGDKKVCLSYVPQQVLMEAAVGLMEGGFKYGAYNFRDSKIEVKTYLDATDRHLKWFCEGEDIDPESGLSHITKAICSLIVLRDAMINDNIIDNRPPKGNIEHMNKLNKIVEELREKYPDPKPPHTEKNGFE